MKTVAIIGGGISGLAAAHRIVERQEAAPDLNVILLEATAKVGGVIQSEYRNGFLLERGPDSFISEKPEALELIKRLGLETHLIETNKTHRRSFIVRNSKLSSV